MIESGLHREVLLGNGGRRRRGKMTETGRKRGKAYYQSYGICCSIPSQLAACEHASGQKDHKQCENRAGEYSQPRLCSRTYDMGEEIPNLQYLQGFGSYHSTEAIPGALPRGRNNPQKPAYGLVCEKLSGTAFTAPRKENQQTYVHKT